MNISLYDLCYIRRLAVMQSNFLEDDYKYGWIVFPQFSNNFRDYIPKIIVL